MISSAMNDHRDAKEYKSSWGDIVLWGGMKTLLNEGRLSTTNNASKKKPQDDVVNCYLKKIPLMHGLLKCGQETSQGNFFFFTTYLYQTLIQEKRENINCRGTYSFKSVEKWTNNLINDTNPGEVFHSNQFK